MVSYGVQASNLGLCLQSYLLMQLIGQSENFFICGRDEYWSGHHCCKECSPGQFVQEPCTIPHTLGQCENCPPGTFTKHSNGLDSCITCSSCDKNQEIVAECSATRDRKCQCKMGYFYSNYSESYEFCLPCNRCPRGIPVLQECKSTANTVCDLAATNHRNRLYLLAPILGDLVLIVALCWYLQNGRPYGAVE